MVGEIEMELDQLPALEKLHYLITQIMEENPSQEEMEIQISGFDNPYTEENEPDDDFEDYLNWHVYKQIFDEAIMDIHNSVYICCSDDLEEGPEIGDYDYLAGWLSSDIPFLFMRSSHPMTYPNRLILDEPKGQIHIYAEQRKISVYPENPSIYQTFFLHPERRRLAELKRMLQNTDRPVMG